MLLRANYADHKLTAAKGQSIHHIAVENDKVLPIIFYKKQLDLNIKNELGETALIYAADIK